MMSPISKLLYITKIDHHFNSKTKECLKSWAISFRHLSKLYNKNKAEIKALYIWIWNFWGQHNNRSTQQHHERFLGIFRAQTDSKRTLEKISWTVPKKILRIRALTRRWGQRFIQVKMKKKWCSIMHTFLIITKELLMLRKFAIEVPIHFWNIRRPHFLKRAVLRNSHHLQGKRNRNVNSLNHH